MAIIIFWIMAMQRSASFSAECSLPQHIPTIVPAQIFINTDHRRTKFSSERKVLASQNEQGCQSDSEGAGYHFKRPQCFVARGKDDHLRFDVAHTAFAESAEGKTRDSEELP